MRLPIIVTCGCDGCLVNLTTIRKTINTQKNENENENLSFI